MSEPSPTVSILVVEDADAVRKLICAMLSQSGYQTMEAANGVEALRLLDSHCGELGLVLTDMVMPKMGGPELARHITQLRPGLRILFMSGYSDDPVVHQIQRVPWLFLPKPFTAATLLEKVRSALDEPWLGLPGLNSGPAGVQ